MSDTGNPSPTPEPNPNPTPSDSPPQDPPLQDPPKEDVPKEPILGEDKPKEETAPEPFDPEKLAFPEGFQKDDEVFGEFTNVANEHKLTGPAAQQLLNLHAKAVQKATDQLMTQWDQQQETWKREVMADKEIGGDKLQEVRQTFAKVAENSELSDPEFKKALVFTGAGNNPAIIRTLYRWASRLSEGGSVQGNPPPRGQGQQTLGTAIYGPEGPHTGGPKLS